MTTKSREFPFIKGVDEETDDKVLPEPRLTSLVNHRVVRPGGLDCRKGVSQLGYGETGPDEPRRLAAFRDELLLFDATMLHVHSAALGWVGVEDSGSVVLESRDTLAMYARLDVVATAAAARSDRLVEAWTTYDGSTYELHVSVKEIEGSTLVAATQVPVTSSTGLTCLKAASSGTSILVMWGDTANRIRGVVVDSSTEGAWESGDIVEFADDCDQTGDQFFDLDGQSPDVVLAYASTTANTVALERLNASGVTQDSDTINVGGANPRVGIVGDVGSNSHLHVVFGTGASSEHKVYRLDSDMSTAASYSEGPGLGFDAAHGIACGKYDATNSAIVYGTTNYAKVAVHNGGAAPTLVSENIYSLVPVSKPFTRDGRVHFASQTFHDQINSYGSIVSVELTSGDWDRARCECRFNGSRAPSDVPANIAVCYGEPWAGQSSLSRRRDTAFIIPIRGLSRASDPVLRGATRTQPQALSVIRADSFTFNLNSGQQFLPVSFGGSLYVGGGQVMQYDGARLTEVGFYEYPDINDSDITVSSTGGALEDGSYIYGFCYEWPDNRGDLHQSAMVLRTVTVDEGTGTAKVDIVTPSLQQTRKHWRLAGDDRRTIGIGVYRSVADGQTLYRLEGPGVEHFVENNPDALTSGTYEDVYSSASISLEAREPAYTTSAGGGELNNMPPPASRIMIAHQDRLIGIMDEDPTKLWYSKSIRNHRGLAWNQALIVQLEDRATALASQDGNLMVFSEHRVYTVVGQGADNTGRGTSYEPPQLLSSETGCIEPRSVVSTPIGLFFRSHQGIMLMVRGGFSAVHTPQIQQTLETYPVVTSGVHDRANSRVCFAVCEDEDQDSDSRVLVYDYGSKVWSVYDYGDGFTIRSLAIDNDNSTGNAGLLCWASAGLVGDDHLVARETSAYSDTLRATESFISRYLETGDLRPGGLAGYSRLKHATLLGETQGPVNLVITEKHDGVTERARTWQMTAETESQRRLSLVRQKARASSFRVEQTESTAVDSAGVRMFGFRFDFRPFRKGSRLAREHQ